MDHIDLEKGSEEYKQVANEVYREMLVQQRAIEQIKPNQNSLFLRELDRLPKIGSGKMMLGTIYTGGVIQASHEKYRQVLLEAYVKDVASNKVVLAWTEMCPGDLGVRCYFEIDYRSFVRFH